MDKRNIVMIILAIIIISGLIYYVNLDSSNNEISQEDTKSEIQQNKDSESINQDDEKSSDESTEETAPIDIGEKAPNFTLDTLSGDIASLEDYKGKIVLINFWATDCPYCVKEMGDLERVYKENKDNDFVVLGIDVGETVPTVEQFIEDGGYTFPVLLDMDASVASRYMIPGVPVSIMVDKEGIIRTKHLGPLTYPQMEEMLEHVRGKN